MRVPMYSIIQYMYWPTTAPSLLLLLHLHLYPLFLWSQQQRPAPAPAPAPADRHLLPFVYLSLCAIARIAAALAYGPVTWVRSSVLWPRGWCSLAV